MRLQQARAGGRPGVTLKGAEGVREREAIETPLPGLFVKVAPQPVRQQSIQQPYSSHTASRAIECAVESEPRQRYLILSNLLQPLEQCISNKSMNKSINK